MQSRISVASVSGSPRGPQVVRILLSYEGRQAEIEFHMAAPQSNEKAESGRIEAELRKAIAALREVENLPEGQMLPHHQKI